MDTRLRQHLVNLEDRIVRMEREVDPDYDMIDAFYRKIDAVQDLVDEETKADKVDAEDVPSSFWNLGSG